MGTGRRSDLGAVMTYVVSPTRAVLIKDKSKQNALWKLPGGGIEESDRDIIAAAIREVLEETGIVLSREEITLVAEQKRENGMYYPYFCVACVSEKKLDTREKVGDEDGKRIMVSDFERTEVPTMLDLLERHRPFIREAEKMLS